MPSIRLVDTSENEIVKIRPEIPNQATDSIACTEFNLGWPEHREAVYERAGFSGSIDLTSLHGPRTISFDLRLFDTSTRTKEQTLDILMAWSQAGRRLYVYARRDGWIEERRMLVRASTLSCSSTRMSALMFTTSLSFICPSGEMESAEVTETIINAAAGTGGGIGLSFPISWSSTGIFFEPAEGQAGSNSGYITNYGNTMTPVYMVLSGRCDNPTIYNRTTGKQLTFKGLKLTSTESLVIDTETGAVVAGSASYYSKIDWTYSSWWGLAPGENKIELAASNTDENCKLTITSRSRWT